MVNSLKLYDVIYLHLGLHVLFIKSIRGFPQLSGRTLALRAGSILSCANFFHDHA